MYIMSWSKLHLKIISSLLIIVFFAISCATIFKGSNADVRVNSAPAGATIHVNDINKGVTPQTMSLKRNKDYVFEFSKDGYEPIKMEVNKKFDLATTVIGNIFSWGLLGIVVDLASGAAYSLTPADLQANLPDLKTSGIIPADYHPKKNEIFVIMMSKEDWERIKQK